MTKIIIAWRKEKSQRRPSALLFFLNNVASNYHILLQVLAWLKLDGHKGDLELTIFIFMLVV